jgi:hypothetical protein
MTLEFPTNTTSSFGNFDNPTSDTSNREIPKEKMIWFISKKGISPKTARKVPTMLPAVDKK